MPLPKGWSDNGKTLLPPDKSHEVVAGFRDAILGAPSWDSGNVPLENEKGVAQIELHNAPVAGTRQLFRDCMMVWSPNGGVKFSATGAEIKTCYDLIASLQAQVKTLQSTALATKLAQASTLVDQLKAALTTS